MGRAALDRLSFDIDASRPSAAEQSADDTLVGERQQPPAHDPVGETRRCLSRRVPAAVDRIVVVRTRCRRRCGRAAMSRYG